MIENGKLARMSELQNGDKVLTGIYSLYVFVYLFPVFMFETLVRDLSVLNFVFKDNCPQQIVLTLYYDVFLFNLS